ncbi:MAG TPA: GNAT family N-acetyltransferase [Streptosporangiaceae bacterium]|jgi:ribosomal-protein-alanine N-acetyltransferase
MSVTRLISVADAPALADLLVSSRDFLAPWEPVRAESYFTEAGQAESLRAALQRHGEGLVRPHVILGDSGQVAGRITLNNIVRGAFQSCQLGYWVGAAYGGRGLGTAAVRDIIGVAFGELGLHRIEAATLLHNVRSQRVLEHNGFARFGVAPRYIRIAGKWQDHAVYQLLNEN